MISRIDFIDKNNIAIGTVAKSYSSVYEFKYPTQKFNEDYNWFATSPSEVSFSLIFDSWIENNIFDEANDSGNKFNKHVVRIYDDEVLFFEGVITVEDLDWDVDSNMIKIIVRDYLILFTDISEIEYDITNASTMAVSRTLPNEPFLQKYAHDIYNLLRILKTTAEQQFFNPNYVSFEIEKDEAILERVSDNKVIFFRNTWIWQDLVFSLSQFGSNPNDGWFDAEIRTFDAHTGEEKFGGTFNLVMSSYQGAAAVEAAINGILFQGGMTDQTWKANYSYAESASATPLVARLYRLEKIEQPTENTDEYRVYRNVINLDLNPSDDNEPNGHNESTNYPTLLNTVLDFKVKQQAPYESPLAGTTTIDGATNIIKFKDYSYGQFALTFRNPNIGKPEGDTEDAFNTVYYNSDATNLTIYYFKISNTWAYSNSLSHCIVYQEKHKFENFVEISSETTYTSYTYAGNRSLVQWIEGDYTNLWKTEFIASQIATRIAATSSGVIYNLTGTLNSTTNEYINYIKVGFNKYTISAKLLNFYNVAQLSFTFTVLYSGYTATPYLNYVEPVNTIDALKIITILNNCSYYCKLNTFYVSDKDYVLDASSETIASSDIIELNRSRVWSAELDDSIYDKLLVFDTKVFKKFVEDYYNNTFFSRVKQLITFTLSTVFNSTVINLGSRLSYLGKDYIVSSWTKIYENIFEITAFNDTMTIAQLSNNGATPIQGELSNNGTLLNAWNIKEV